MAVKDKTKYDYINYGKLDKRYQKLLGEAKVAMKTAYIPYSKSRVGAAILTKDGKTISASCVVPRSRDANICSERAAIVKANSMGKRSFSAIAVIGEPGIGHGKGYMFTPCGECRQLLAEFSETSGIDTKVIMSNLGMTRILVLPISELLPLAYE